MTSFLLSHIAQQNADVPISSCRFIYPQPDLSKLQTCVVHFVAVIHQKQFALVPKKPCIPALKKQMLYKLIMQTEAALFAAIPVTPRKIIFCEDHLSFQVPHKYFNFQWDL
jgi:hypothetical protein